MLEMVAQSHPAALDSRPEIASLARQLGTGSLSAVDALFAEAGAPSPVVQWAPDTRTAGNPLIIKFAEICDSMSDATGTIQRDVFSLQPFGSMQDWMMVLDRVPNEANFRYRHYGRGIADNFGHDMKGCTTSDFDGHISTFFTALYMAATDRRQRVLSIHQPPERVFVSSWRRLLVPMRSPGKRVDGFVVLNLPENELRAGLEAIPAPVLIVDSDQIVRFANKDARQIFDLGRVGPWNRSLFDYAGLDIVLDDDPLSVLKTGVTQHVATRYLHHKQLASFHVKLSATMHHGRAFWVLLLRGGIADGTTE